MRLKDHVSPQQLKELNLLLLLESAKQVGGGAELRKRSRARAKMVSDAMLASLVDEMPDVARQGARGAWSHWMALVATRQPFFDANHRTALGAFNAATRAAWAFEYILSNDDLEAMMTGSRRLVKEAHRPGAEAPRRASVGALRDPLHPARAFYAGFESRLKERPLPT